MAVGTGGHHADYCFLLTRTDPEAPKHKGISYLLVPMRQPGIEVRGITQPDGTAEFCEVFFTDARIPLENIVGEVDGGWSVANSLLGHERGEEAATNPILFRAELDRLIAMAKARERTGDAVVRNHLADAYTRCEVMRFLGLRILTGVLKDGVLAASARGRSSVRTAFQSSPPNDGS